MHATLRATHEPRRCTAIEDAGVLGEMLALLPDGSAESINKALRVYEGGRKERVEMLVELAAASGASDAFGRGEGEGGAR